MQNRISPSQLVSSARAIRGRLDTHLLNRAAKKSVWTDAVVYATALSVFAGRSAFAQDVLGVTPVATAFIAFLDIVAVIGIGWGFTRLMTGRHTVEGLFAMGVGVLGIAKAPTIVAFLGA